MKKLVSMIIMVCILVVGGGNAFAFQGEELISIEENTYNTDREVKLQELRENKKRFNTLKEFQNEIQQLNQLKIQGLNLRIEVVEKHSTILDLYITAIENQMKEELQQAKEIRQEIKELNRQIIEYREEIKLSINSFREAVKVNEIEEARKHIDNVIHLKGLVNSKISEKLLLLDKIIIVLSV